MIPKINQMIASDIKEKMKERNLKDKDFVTNDPVCSTVHFSHIKSGLKKRQAVPLKILMAIYEKMGLKEINVKDGDMSLVLKW